MSERSTVVGVFTDDVSADLAADELRRVGFSDDEISIAKHQAKSASFPKNLISFFTGQDATPIKTADDFIRMGVPEQDANYYQNELEAGRTIELVRVADQQQEVLEILHHYGAEIARHPDHDDHAETNYPDDVSGMYDPIAKRENVDFTPPPEDYR